MIYICILLYVLIATFSLSAEIQLQFTDHEIPEQLRTSQENAPASKTIVHSIHKRSTDELSITLNIDGTDRGYTLQRKKGFFAGLNTKIWLAEKKKKKRSFKYILQENIMGEVNITLHQDRKTRSIISHSVNKRGISEFSGIIDSDKVIRPYIRERRDIPSKSFRKRNDANNNNYHIVDKRATADRRNNNSPNSSVIDININKLLVEKHDAVYPEILIFVDTTLFNNFKNNTVKTVAYTLTLMSGADLRLKDIKDPTISLNIAGIVLCKDQLFKNDPFVINEKNLEMFSKFMLVQKKFIFKEDYDVAILLGMNTNPDEETIGLSYEKGVCLNNIKAKVINSTALVMDNTGFSGIQTAAYELANLFGASVDDEKPGPCSQEKGYMMSYNLHDEKQFYFSPCSKNNMTTFLRSEQAKCLRNDPGIDRTDEEILRILPGKYMTIDEQCQKLGYGKANEVTPAICSNIKCQKDNNESIEPNPPVAALEGTVCDPQLAKFCWRGECVEPKFVDIDDSFDSKMKFLPPN